MAKKNEVEWRYRRYNVELRMISAILVGHDGRPFKGHQVIAMADLFNASLDAIAAISAGTLPRLRHPVCHACFGLLHALDPEAGLDLASRFFSGARIPSKSLLSQLRIETLAARDRWSEGHKRRALFRGWRMLAGFATGTDDPPPIQESLLRLEAQALADEVERIFQDAPEATPHAKSIKTKKDPAPVRLRDHLSRPPQPAGRRAVRVLPTRSGGRSRPGRGVRLSNVR